MGDKFTRQAIGTGVHFSAIRDPKFKHNRLTVSMILPLSKETASDNGVVPFILRTGCRECPDFSSLNARLCDLYGASLDGDVSKYGAYQLLDLSIKGLDNRFALEGEDITAQCAQLLASLALDPKLDDAGLFAEEDVALQRQYLLDSIEAEINDKRTYAYSRCIQVMCAGEPVAVRKYGDVETARAITPKSATEAYKQAIKTAQIEIIFTGSGDPESALNIFKERFAALEREPITVEPVALKETADKVREETERMDVTQAKLVMGLRTGPVNTPQDLNARRLFAALFGGTPFSKLFLNVREKLSLCYYCAARFEVATRLLVVDSGVEEKNKQKAQDEILAQLKDIQAGKFEDEELVNTKMLLRNAITSSNDSLSGLESWYTTQILRGQKLSPEEEAANMDKVTREQIVEAAKAVTLDTVYFLTGNQKEGA